MKWIYNSLIALLIIATSIFSSCDDDKDTSARAVLTSAEGIEFEATNAASQIITVYADADWVSEAPEWVTVNPGKGTGTMDVTISVNDNLRDGAIDNPRKETVIFKGKTLASQAKLIVFQNGDKYRDAKEYKLEEIAALEDESIVLIPEAFVTAITADGFIVSDAQNKNESNIFVSSNETVKIGDKIKVQGSKMQDAQALTYITADKVTNLSHDNAIVYITPEDITNQIDTYTSKTRAYITAAGTLNGNIVSVGDSKIELQIYNEPASIDLTKLNGHNLIVTGYFAGLTSSLRKINPVAIEDKGVNEIIYFSEDFEWLHPWAVEGGAGKQVENDGSTDAPQIYSATYDGKTTDQAITDKGYTLLESRPKCIYLQDGYLKFGKTDYQAGLILPSIDNIPAGTKLKLTFDYAPMVGGTRKFDPVKVIVTIKNGDDETEVGSFGHSFVDTESTLSWLHAEAVIEGINITKETQIIFKSDGWGDTKATTGSSVYKRWFLDNIKIVQAK